MLLNFKDLDLIALTTLFHKDSDQLQRPGLTMKKEALLGGGGRLAIPYPLNSGDSYPLSLKLPGLLSLKLFISEM